MRKMRTDREKELKEIEIFLLLSFPEDRKVLAGD